jgi:ElaB/YqjD/DUF883 family membrane-anchored ribosome-binding protein
MEEEAVMKDTSLTSRTIVDSYELAQQVADMREDLQKLSATVGRIASTQLDRAKYAANEVEDSIKHNPISAIAIAVGLGVFLSILMRR